jgi:large subunit ribosomal protein L15
MKIHDLMPQKGSRKNLRRVGRGTGGGQGKTAGKGTKGQLARSGPGLPAWFEGGQMPLHMRLPKLRGFKNRHRIEFVALNVAQLKNYAVNGKVTPETLATKGLIQPLSKVKLLGNGDITTKLEVHAHRVSAAARQKIESAGGKIVLIDAGNS